jgi:CxxC-x17-CxxC domain-containing protein
MKKVSDLAELMVQIQQQLASLEKKIDIVINRPQERPFEGKRNFTPPQRFDPAQRILHKAVCADCKKECEVPFRPTGDRPVYCKECFSKRKASEPFKQGGDHRHAEPRHTDSRHAESGHAESRHSPKAPYYKRYTGDRKAGTGKRKSAGKRKKRE